jgi:hypothetical protein
MIERGENLAEISDVMGRESGYYARYIPGKGPRRLADQEQRDLARYVRVAPQLFGAPVDEVAARPAGAISKPIKA